MKTDKTPWLDAKLEREISADFLSKYLCSRYDNRKRSHGDETIVLALNSEWGFGKTYFLRNWKLDLEYLDYPVVNYDAWENDYTGDPLVGFIAEVDKALRPRIKNIPVATRLLTNTINSAKKIIRPATGVLVDIVAKKLTSYSTEQLKEIFSEPQQDSIANQTFKKNLSALVRHLERVSSVRLPIFIYVDELDRCRPTYAIELLENIKHLFGVEGVYFVVATNIGQLSHSVSALYGEKFNAEQYLKRFFDQEYLLPSPKNEKFASHLFSLLGLENESRFFTGLNSKLYPAKQPEALFSIYATSFNLSLRDQQQIAAALKAIVLVSSFKTLHLNYLLFLLIVRHRSHEAFSAIVNELATTPDHVKFISIAKPLLVQDLGVSSLVPVKKGDPFAGQTARRVPLVDIAWMYHYHAMRDLKEIREMDIYGADFPTSMLAKLTADEMPSSYFSNQAYPSTLRVFFSLAVFFFFLLLLLFCCVL